MKAICKKKIQNNDEEIKYISLKIRFSIIFGFILVAIFCLFGFGFYFPQID